MIDEDMYGIPDEEEAARPKNEVSVVPGVNTHDIVVNGQRIRVVDPTYVARLESRLLVAERMLTELRAEMVRLQDNNRSKARDMHLLQTQLDRKIDRN